MRRARPANHLGQASGAAVPGKPPAQVRVAIISNRNSGHNRQQFPAIATRLAQCAGLRHHVTDHAHELPAVLAQLAADGLDILAINGGDGTAAAIFRELFESRPFATLPDLVLLPGGTANMTAGDVGVRGSLKAAVKRFCRWHDAGCPRPGHALERHVLAVRAGDLDGTHYGMFIGGGAIIHATEYAHAEVHSRGLRDDFSLGLVLVRAIWGMVRGEARFSRPSPVSVSVDGGEFHDYDALILAASTLQRLFLGIRPFWGQGEAPLQLSLVESGALRLLRSFPGILRGRPGRKATPANGYHSWRAQELRLLLDGHLNMDGEILDATRSRGPVSIRPAGPLRFIRL